MKDLKFDGIIFGNGMTINLLQQLESYIIEEKQYLLDLDDFLKNFIADKLPLREENVVFNKFYNKKDIVNIKYFQKLKNELSKYYLKNDYNIEKVIGRDIFFHTNEVLGYDLSTIRSLFPALYNIWFDILYDYIIHEGLEKYIDSYYKSIKSVITNTDNVYTTNFDYFADDSLNPKHLHGKFVKNLRKYKDISLYRIDDNEFYFKYIWGYNGLGKMNLINEISNLGDFINKYFDFNFFFNNNLKIDNLLIYGLSFQRHGFITENFLERFPKYKDDMAFGSVIDEHILIRIKGLQTLNQLKNIVVSYYSENTRNYFQKLINQYEINNVEFVHASEFNFSIYYI